MLAFSSRVTARATRTRRLTSYVVGVTAAAALLLLPGSLNPVGPVEAQAAGLIAPRSVCKDFRADGGRKAMRKARRSMRCFVNYARKRSGLRHLKKNRKLVWSAKRKSGDIIRCSFSHTACGRKFEYWILRSGYANSRNLWAGENVAWGGGALGNVKTIFIAWMKSPGHRRAILSRTYRHLGVGVTKGKFRNYSGVRSWVLHFGRR